MSEAESEIDKNCNNVEHTSFETESGLIDDNQNVNNDDNVPPKPNIIEDIIHNMIIMKVILLRISMIQWKNPVNLKGNL